MRTRLGSVATVFLYYEFIKSRFEISMDMKRKCPLEMNWPGKAEKDELREKVLTVILKI